MKKVMLLIAVVAIMAFAAPVLAGGTVWEGIGLPDNMTGNRPGETGANRHSNNDKSRLSRMVRDIQRIEADSKYALAPWQAAKVLKVLKPFTTQEKMTEEEAKESVRRMKYIFTPEQVKKMNELRNAAENPQTPQGEPKVEVFGDTRDYEKKVQAQNKNKPEAEKPAEKPKEEAPRVRQERPKDYNPFYLKAEAKDDRTKERIENLKKFFASMETKAAKAK